MSATKIKETENKYLGGDCGDGEGSGSGEGPRDGMFWHSL